MPNAQAEKGRCEATTESGTPCQKRGPHAGHWFMSDDLWACLNEDHFDPTNVLSLTPLVHLDVPCPRRPGHCRDCGEPFMPVQRGECSRCGSDGGPVSRPPACGTRVATAHPHVSQECVLPVLHDGDHSPIYRPGGGER